jgi:hypothetical protein
MAQKKKKEPEVKEDYNFVPPDFNEREFLVKDINVTKTVLLSALLAVVFGVVAYFTTSISFAIGLLLIIGGAIALKYIFNLMPWDFSTVENKSWLGNGAMFFFLALGIWILLLNPPFGDAVDPEINDMQVWAGNVEFPRPYNSVPMGQPITFNATVTDNGGLDAVQFSFTGSGGLTWDMTVGEDGRYEYTHVFTSTGTYNFAITATDDVGNVQTMTGSVNVV